METYVVISKYPIPRGNIKIIKKNKQIENFNIDKILLACSKSAYRALIPYTEDLKQSIAQKVSEKIEASNKEMFDITEIHNIVENSLDEVNEKIAKSYRDYRNYKRDFVKIMDDVYRKSQSTMYAGDRDNANSNSALVTTIRALECQYLNTGLYEQFFLNEDEKNAADLGYIYVHDKGARRHTFNCCLFDVANVLSDGFEMGNIWYNEPKTLDVAGDVIGDIVLSAAGAQYGGFTIPEVDKILSPYAEKSYRKFYKKYYKMLISAERKSLKTLNVKWDSLSEETKKKLWMQADEDAKKEAYKDLCKEMEQVFQGWEYKFNTVGSSRGDYPFLTMTFGLATDRFGKLASMTALKVRRGGQGKKGYKKPVLFPKLVFLYDENLHGKGQELEDVFEEGIKTSATTMYPDWLSLTGDSYVSEMYKKYKKVISPMGKCKSAHVKHPQTNRLLGVA